MRILAGTVARPSVHAEEIGKTKVESLTISVTEHAESDAVWRYTVDAVLGRPQANVRRLGTLESVPPATTGYPTRVLGVASLPGVVQWIVSVERYSGTDPDPQGGYQPTSWPSHYVDLELSVSDELTTPGLTPNEPHAELFGERYLYLAGTLTAPGPTNVAVPANQRVQIVSCWQSGTGMTFAIDGGNAIPVPPDGSGVAQPLGRIRGALNVTFASIPAGGGGYLIELTN